MPTKAGYVAIIGKPNAGKSTLMNSILGSKLSIVTPKPQTTRRNVLGIYTEGDLQVVFFDTPGILKPRYELQKAMLEYINNSLDGSDLVLFILDAEKFQQNPGYFDGNLAQLLKNTGLPIIAVLNKIDLLDNMKSSLPLIAGLHETGIFNHIIPLSALKSANLKELINAIEKYLPESPFFYDEDLLSTQPERFFIAEIIREQVFLRFGQEIPYSTEVQISEFRERAEGKWFIAADIIIERKSQKAIVIGAGGQKIKEIGERSRIAIEKHLDQPVFLELFVKVRENWRDSKNALKWLGY